MRWQISNLALKTVYVLASCWTIFALHLAPAVAQIPQGAESYLSRPNVLTVEAKAQSLGKTWESLKAAHFAFIAQMLEFYPEDTEFYFLARDAEHLYDVANLVTQKTADAKRMHLLNVSRANMRHPLLKPYLEQNGISEEAIRSGKKIVLVDTGFGGTIPRVIGELFPEEVREKIQTHLIVSSNIKHPSSRLFLVHLNPASISEHPSAMHGTIVTYEHIPRYTDRSTQFFLENGVYHPLSPLVSGGEDGAVSKIKSLQRMRDLKAEWANPKIRQHFRSTRKLIQEILTHLRQGQEADLIALQQYLQSEQKVYVEAIIRDALDLGGDFHFSLQELNLKESRTASGGPSKKSELIKKYPSWAPILEDPQTGIPQLFVEENWQMIGNLIDISVDSEINKILMLHLYDGPATGIKRDLQIAVIEKADQAMLRLLALFVFTEPQTKDLTDLLRRIIEKADQDVLQIIASETFSQSHTFEMTDLLSLIVKKAHQGTLAALAQYVFSEPYTKNMTDLLRLLIKKSKRETWMALARYTFAQEHTQDKGDLLFQLIKMADQPTLQTLARYTFSQPHTKDFVPQLRLAIEKADQTSLFWLITETFSKPHQRYNDELLKMIIERSDDERLSNLVDYAFSKRDAKDIFEHLKLTVEKAGQETLLNLSQSILSQPNTSKMNDLVRLIVEKADATTAIKISYHIPYLAKPTNRFYRILKESTSIEDLHERKVWIDKQLSTSSSKAETPAKGRVSKTENETVPHEQFNPISPQLKPGDQFRIKDQSMTVVKKVDQGRRGVVFQVKAEADEQLYALKVAIDSKLETLESLSKESAKAEAWKKLGIPHARVLVQEQNYVLKDWISGISGDEVIQRYLEGDQAYAPGALQVIELVAKIRDQGAYIGDFRPANLIWTGQHWVIIDSGSIQVGMTLEEAQAKWNEADSRGPKFKRRWRLNPPPLVCQDLLKNS